MGCVKFISDIPPRLVCVGSFKGLVPKVSVISVALRADCLCYIWKKQQKLTLLEDSFVFQSDVIKTLSSVIIIPRLSTVQYHDKPNL